MPIGEYDNTRSLNLSQNRWYGRIGAPIILQIGPWVPGRRTTLELLPAVWFFGTNDDFVGKTLSTDPMFQVDAHLTRDFTERIWGSLDGVWYTGGKATIDGVEGDKLDNLGIGVPSTTRLPGTSRWTGSWSRWSRGGTPSSRRRSGWVASSARDDRREVKRKRGRR